MYLSLGLLHWPPALLLRLHKSRNQGRQGLGGNSGTPVRGHIWNILGNWEHSQSIDRESNKDEGGKPGALIWDGNEGVG